MVDYRQRWRNLCDAMAEKQRVERERNWLMVANQNEPGRLPGRAPDGHDKAYDGN